MFKLALKDICEGIKKASFWSYMAWQEIVIRYRRSVLGPLWITASTAIYIVAISLVFSSLFNQELKYYLLYMSIGVVIWNLINQTIVDSTDAFIANAGFIKQISIPKTVFIFQGLTRNIYFFLHNLIIIVVCFIFFDANLTTYSLMHTLAGLLILTFNLFFISLSLACICTRFMDLRQIIYSILQIGFLVTPVMWIPSESMKSKIFLLSANPIYHFLDFIRQPLLPVSFPTSIYHPSFNYILAFTLVNILISIFVFSWARNKISYWV